MLHTHAQGWVAPSRVWVPVNGWSMVGALGVASGFSVPGVISSLDGPTMKSPRCVERDAGIPSNAI